MFSWFSKYQGEKNAAQVFCSSDWYPSIYATPTFIYSLLFNSIHLSLYSSSLINVFMNTLKIVKYYQKAKSTQAQWHLWISWKSLSAYVCLSDFFPSGFLRIYQSRWKCPPLGAQPILCCPL